MALDEENQVIGYEFIHLGKMMEAIKKGIEPAKAMEDAKGHMAALKKQLRTSIRDSNRKAKQWNYLKATTEELIRSSAY